MMIQRSSDRNDLPDYYWSIPCENRDTKEGKKESIPADQESKRRSSIPRIVNRTRRINRPDYRTFFWAWTITLEEKT